MRSPEPISATTELEELVVRLGRIAAECPAPAIAALLGHLERLRGVLWERLFGELAGSLGARDRGDPLAELRHLTPAQVAELLSLKEPYVHELCRTGRLPAVKEGKYWIIPIAGLHAWRARQSRPVDAPAGGSLASARDAGRRTPRKMRRPRAVPRPTRRTHAGTPDPYGETEWGRPGNVSPDGASDAAGSFGAADDDAS